MTPSFVENVSKRFGSLRGLKDLSFKETRLLSATAVVEMMAQASNTTNFRHWYLKRMTMVGGVLPEHRHSLRDLPRNLENRYGKNAR